jgi:hypothetical protein
MTSDEADRVVAACRLLGEHPEERRLLHAEVEDIVLHRSGTSETFEVRFKDGTRGAFKSIEGAASHAGGHGHTGPGVILNDVASWLVARGLGYDQLLRGVVIRPASVAGAGIGSLQTWLDGEPSGDGWKSARNIRQAALFDSVTAQQDRNGGNFNYDATADEVGLFDQSFTFALPGHQQGACEIVAEVHRADEAELDDELGEALDQLEASPELANLGEVLSPERVARVHERIAAIRERGELLQPGEY